MNWSLERSWKVAVAIPSVVILSLSSSCQPNSSDSQGAQPQIARQEGLQAQNQTKISVCLLAANDAARINALFAAKDGPGSSPSESDLASRAETGPKGAEEDSQFSRIEAELRLSQSARNQPCTANALTDFERSLGNVALNHTGSDAAPTSMSLIGDAFSGTLNASSGNARYSWIRGIGRVVVTKGGSARAYSLNDFSPSLFMRTVQFLLIND